MIMASLSPCVQAVSLTTKSNGTLVKHLGSKRGNISTRVAEDRRIEALEAMLVQPGGNHR